MKRKVSLKNLAIVVSLSIVLFFATGITAQAVIYPSIGVFVYGSNAPTMGNELANAKVTLNGTWTDYTGTDTAATFHNVNCNQNYTVTVSADGYQPVTTSFYYECDYQYISVFGGRIKMYTPKLVSVVLPLSEPQYTFIGNASSSGFNNKVHFYGMQNGQCTHGYATCRGNWWVDPCNWTSGCDTGWEWDPANYYPDDPVHCTGCN